MLTKKGLLVCELISMAMLVRSESVQAYGDVVQKESLEEYKLSLCTTYKEIAHDHLGGAWPKMRRIRK